MNIIKWTRIEYSRYYTKWICNVHTPHSHWWFLWKMFFFLFNSFNFQSRFLIVFIFARAISLVSFCVCIYEKCAAACLPACLQCVYKMWHFFRFVIGLFTNRLRWLHSKMISKQNHFHLCLSFSHFTSFVAIRFRSRSLSRCLAVYFHCRSYQFLFLSFIYSYKYTKCLSVVHLLWIQADGLVVWRSHLLSFFYGIRMQSFTSCCFSFCSFLLYYKSLCNVYTSVYDAIANAIFRWPANVYTYVYIYI